MIKVLLADDSPVVRAVLTDIFHATTDLVVVGEAENGQEAVDLTQRLKPDVVVMDLSMPIMDGLTAIETIMSKHPTPILVLSATVDDREVNYAFTAIKKGALDVMEKPGSHSLDQGGDFAETITAKLRMLSRIKVIRRWPSGTQEKVVLKPCFQGGGKRVLAIGASTGGPRAVLRIMKSLPAKFNGTVFIVQHIASGFARGFAHWLDQESAIKVRVAVNGQPARPGEALLAPNDCHMMLSDGKIKLVQSEPVNCCRPSIDVLFESVAQEEGTGVVGVLLTGMGKDGARGMLRIKEHGGITIAQDEESCAVFGMPKAAIALHAVDEILPLQAIPDALSRFFTD